MAEYHKAVLIRTQDPGPDKLQYSTLRWMTSRLSICAFLAVAPTRQSDLGPHSTGECTCVVNLRSLTSSITDENAIHQTDTKGTKRGVY